MKRITKVILALGLFLLMAGGLLALSGWAMGGRKDVELNWNGHTITLGRHGFFSGSAASWEPSGDAETREDLHLAAFTELDVDVELGHVAVVPGDDYGVALCWQSGRYRLDYANEDGTLKVWSNSPSGLHLEPGSDFQAWVTVYVPDGALLDQVELKTALGELTVEGLRCRSLDCSNDLGDLGLSGVEAEEMELDVSLGSLNGDSLTVTKELHASNDLGDILLEGDLRGQLDITCELGSAELITSAPLSEFGYDLEVDLGSLTVNGEDFRGHASRQGGPSYLKAENDLGDLQVSFGWD